MLLAALLAALPAAVSASAESVTYTSPDGFTIAADLYQPDRPSAMGILILPDPKEGRGAWTVVADSLRSAGFHVLVADLRGTGGSALQRTIRRDRSHFTSVEQAAARLDAEAGLRYLRELPATTIREVALVGSGEADRSILQVHAGIMDRLSRVVISPASPVYDVTAGTEAGPILILVSNADVLGIGAAAALTKEDAERECWIVDGNGRGADLMKVRLDLIPDWTGWLRASLMDR